MEREVGKLLQNVQDIMADLTSLPMVLLDWGSVRKQIESDVSKELWARSLLESKVTSWSNQYSLYRLLLQDPIVWREFCWPFKGIFEDVEKRFRSGKWDAYIFKGFKEFVHFTCPICQMGQGGERAIKYVLCGGPIRLGLEALDPSEYYQKEGYLREEEARKVGPGLLYQLISEEMYIAARPGKEGLEFEANTCRLTFNAVVRDLLEPAIDGQLEFDLGAAVVELFRHARHRNRYGAALRSLLKLCPEACAAGLLLDNPVTETGFFAFLQKGERKEGSAGGEGRQLIYIPRKEDVEIFLQAERWEDVPKQDLRTLVLPEECSFLKRFPIEPVMGYENRGCAFLWFKSARQANRACKAHQRDIDAYLLSMAVIFGSNRERILWRQSQAKQNRLGRERNELGDLVLGVRFIEGEEQRAFMQLLEGARELVHFDQATYYRPHLFLPEIDAEAFAWVPGQLAGEDIPIDTEMFNALFNRLEVYVREDEGSAFVPVVAQNRCLGILQYAFKNSASLREALPSMNSLANRLGLRVPYRRLLEILREIVEVSQAFPFSVEKLAQKFAFLFGEAACLIYLLEKDSRLVKLLSCAGLDVPPLEISVDDPKSRFFETSLQRSAVVHVNANSISLYPELDAELLQKRIHHGLVVSADSEELGLLVLFWSKTDYNERYFSSDDYNIASYMCIMLLQFLRLEKFLTRHEQVHDRILTGLGHELRAPLAAIEEGVSIASRSFDPRTTRDIEAMARYARAVVDALFAFAELGRPRKKARGAKRSRVRLFEEILYRARTAMEVLSKPKGIAIKIEFDPRTFPAYLELTEEEQRSIYCIGFNLLSNAVKYTPIGGERDIVIEGRVESNWLRVEFVNYGIGVLAKEKDAIFGWETRGENAYFTAPTGSGLGLFISKEIASLLGGRVVLTKLHKPTIFSLLLPKELAVWEQE